jgi:hypothetical protein
MLELTSPMTTERFSLRDNARAEQNPWGIIKHREAEIDSFSAKPLRGDWVRVFPKTGKDMRFLQMLTHQVEKFAPTHGCGVLIKADLLVR